MSKDKIEHEIQVDDDTIIRLMIPSRMNVMECSGLIKKLQRYVPKDQTAKIIKDEIEENEEESDTQPRLKKRKRMQRWTDEERHKIVQWRSDFTAKEIAQKLGYVPDQTVIDGVYKISSEMNK